MCFSCFRFLSLLVSLCARVSLCVFCCFPFSCFISRFFHVQVSCPFLSFSSYLQCLPLCLLLFPWSRFIFLCLIVSLFFSALSHSASYFSFSSSPETVNKERAWYFGAVTLARVDGRMLLVAETSMEMIFEGIWFPLPAPFFWFPIFCTLGWWLLRNSARVPGDTRFYFLVLCLTLPVAGSCVRCQSTPSFLSLIFRFVSINFQSYLLFFNFLFDLFIYLSIWLSTDIFLSN